MRFLIAIIIVVSFTFRLSFGRKRNGVVQSNNRPSHELDSNLENSEHLFSNTWAVHLEGGERMARDIAEKHGFIFIRQIGGLEDHYLLEHSKVENRRSRRSLEHHSLLESEPNVHWVEQQKILKRTKRGFQDFTDPLFTEQWYLKNRGKILLKNILKRVNPNRDCEQGCHCRFLSYAF